MNMNQLGLDAIGDRRSPAQLSPSITDTKNKRRSEGGSEIGSTRDDELGIVTYKGEAFVKLGRFLAERKSGVPCNDDGHTPGNSHQKARRKEEDGATEVQRAEIQYATDHASALGQERVNAAAPLIKAAANASSNTKRRNSRMEIRSTGVGRHPHTHEFEKTALPQMGTAVKIAGENSAGKRAGPYAAGQLKTPQIAVTMLQAPPPGEVASKAAETTPVSRQRLADIDAALGGVSVWEG